MPGSTTKKGSGKRAKRNKDEMELASEPRGKKDARSEIKAKKAAEIAAVQLLAEEFFDSQMQTEPCQQCKDLQTKLQESEERISDLTASVETKRAVISNLNSTMASLKAEKERAVRKDGNNFHTC